jgi:hypothetical protein
VQIDALVTDAAGNPVAGLTQNDFEVSEGGKPRDITNFAAVDIPVPTAVTAGIGLESDMVTNGIPPGRTYLIALDEVDPQNALKARHFLRDFIEKNFGPNDVAGVSLTGRGFTSSAQDFTSNKRLILEAIDKFNGGFNNFDNMLSSSNSEGACHAVRSRRPRVPQTPRQLTRPVAGEPPIRRAESGGDIVGLAPAGLEPQTPHRIHGENSGTEGAALRRRGPWRSRPASGQVVPRHLADSRRARLPRGDRRCHPRQRHDLSGRPSWPGHRDDRPGKLRYRDARRTRGSLPCWRI